MKGYLGETLVNINDTPFKDYTPSDWALYFIGQYGATDGAHHKDWVLDQVAKALHGTKPIIKLAKWSNGKEEYRVSLAEPTSQYDAWVAQLRNGENGPDTYEYSAGIAP
jgi:hypothetical protein